MRVLVGTERSPIEVDISEIVREGGHLNILPQVKNYFSVDYKPKENKLSLAVKGYIGIIPITTNLAIDIRPKFSIKNLSMMVSVAQEKFQPLSYFSRTYNEKENFSEIVHEFLIESLIFELKTLYSEGIYKEYLRRNNELNNLKGKLDIISSMKKSWSHGKFHRAHSSYFELSINTPLNQVIKYTLHHCLTNLPKRILQQDKILNSLVNFYNIFDNVDLQPNTNFLSDSLEALKNQKIPILRNYYTNICEICRLIITGGGIDFDNHGSSLNLSSFIINMESIFEKFLLNTTREYKKLFGEEITILDGNNEGKKPFFDTSSDSFGDAKPDVVIKRNMDTILIIDAKYKSATKNEDRYQVISHALSFDCNKAVLVLPSKTGKTFARKLGNVGTYKHVEVYEIYIDLSAEELNVEQEKMVNLLTEII